MQKTFLVGVRAENQMMRILRLEVWPVGNLSYRYLANLLSDLYLFALRFYNQFLVFDFSPDILTDRHENNSQVLTLLLLFQPDRPGGIRGRESYEVKSVVLSTVSMPRPWLRIPGSRT